MQLNDSERNILQGLLKTTVYGEVEVEKSYNFRKLQRNNLFWQGFHYQFPRRQHDGGIRLETSAGSDTQGNRRAYDYVLNYYRGDGKKLVGILGRTPNAIVSADDEQDEDYVARAATANVLLTNLRWHWDVETLNGELVYGLWTCGTMYGYTPYVADSRRYGKTDVPVIESRRVMVEPAAYVCWNCGTYNRAQGACVECGTVLSREDFRPAVYEDMQVPVAYNAYANGSVQFHLYSGYEVIVPSRIKSLQEANWLICEREIHRGELLLAYPEARPLLDQINGGANAGGALTALGTTSRSLAVTPSQVYTPKTKNFWTESLVWVTPAQYEIFEMEGSPELAERFRKDRPNGAKIAMLNGIVVRMEPENFHECWHECKAEVGQYLDTQALGDDYIRANRLIDDVFNIQVETAEKGLPLTFYDPQMLDPNALRGHAANPVDFLPVMPGTGGRIREALHTTEGVEMTNAPMQMATQALGAVRENAGVTPPLFGGETGSQTLGEAELKRNMALMPHNITWNFMRRFWAGCYANGIRQLAKYGYQEVYFGGQRNQPVRKLDMPDLGDLLEGGWHVECEEAVPMTWGQRRAQVNQFLDRGPEFWQLLGLNNPNNLSTLLKTMGNEDIELPGINERRKALMIISELLKGEPVQDRGMLLPSIPADEFEDNHEFMVQVVREWAATKAGMRAREESPAGYANVIAWGREHQMMAMPPPLPPEEGGEAEGGPSGPVSEQPDGPPPESQDMPLEGA